MPRLTFVTELTANQLGYNPLTGWEFEKVPMQYGNGAIVKVSATCEIANTVRLAVQSGSQTIQTRSPVTLEATVGVLPADLDTSPLVFRAGPGDQVKLSFDEIAGGTPYVQGIVDIEPL